jgi:serine protease inhibitor
VLVAVCCVPANTLSAGTETIPDPAVIDADNEFGLKLFKTLTADANADNVAISPTSVAMALQIVYNGARGSTARAMAAALQLNALNAQNVNVANQGLQASLANAGPEVELTIANSLWIWRNGRVIPSFKRINQDYYAAEIGDLAGAPANVNAWISEKTHGLITKVLPDKDYGNATAVIANAIYFKGAWSAAFDPKSTASGSFTTGAGRQVTCPMMKLRRYFPYFQAGDFRAIRLDYGADRRLSMLVLLPNSGTSLQTVVAEATLGNLKHWLTQFRWSEVELSLPRFKAAYRHSLPVALTTLGMGIAFDPNRADFSGIAPATAISDVEHATLVQVDESGTTAAAAATETAVITSVMRVETFSADHPFFYAIVDDETGALLFLGTLNDPT